MSNRALWDRVCKTDPKHVKPITGKQYSGNSPKPYYIVERLTDEFGPCGTGWGFEVVSERFERFSDTDTLHVALVSFWYVIGERRGHFQQMGQTKASYMTNAGKFMLDEDAPKKSVTDALVKCASYLGFAGDIFSGRWDDSKYVSELRKEFAEKEQPSREQQIRAAADAAIAKFNEGNEYGAYEEVCSITDNEEMLLLWGYLGKANSALRAAIKRLAAEERAKQKAIEQMPSAIDARKAA